MDPTACYLEMYRHSHSTDYETARERACALKEWIDGGGFYPVNYTRTEVDGYLANVLRRTAHLADRF